MCALRAVFETSLCRVRVDVRGRTRTRTSSGELDRGQGREFTGVGAGAFVGVDARRTELLWIGFLQLDGRGGECERVVVREVHREAGGHHVAGNHVRHATGADPNVVSKCERAVGRDVVAIERSAVRFLDEPSVVEDEQGVPGVRDLGGDPVGREFRQVPGPDEVLDRDCRRDRRCERR